MSEPFTVKDYSSDEAWLSARNFGIGASEVSVVLGLNPWKSPFALFAEKLGLKLDTEELERLRWGILLEGPIADQYAKVTGRLLEDLGRRTILVSTRWPWLCCTLDRRIVNDPRGLGVCEIKNSSEYQSDEWRDEPPLIYQIQAQAQMAVTGYLWGAVVALIGGNRLVHFDVERNESFIEAMAEKTRAFHEAVQRREPPIVDGSNATAQALARLFPAETEDSPIELGGEFIEIDARRQEAAEMIKKYKAIEDECNNKIKAGLGDHAVGVIRGIATYSWRTVNRKAYSVAATSYRQLRRSA